MIVVDVGHGRSVSFWLALKERDWSYVLAVDPKEIVQPEAAEPSSRFAVLQARPAGKIARHTAQEQAADGAGGTMRWRVDHDHRELKRGPSLDYFDVRTLLTRGDSVRQLPSSPPRSGSASSVEVYVVGVGCQPGLDHDPRP
ncbi:hypothetical protein [Streptomyces violaceusniger]|uniref:hypothetical protein n=1 Tax=Streptomyces violaceusniger TaxID=68280 RepID=UPI000D19F117|nr:hypothetical protein [Streptomyces hygroscopicus]